MGVEVEVQLVDWKTLELCPAAPRLLRMLPGPAFHPEYFQCNLELVTGVCATLGEVEADLRRSGQQLLAAADSLGVDVLGVGTHPFDGGHRDEPRFPSERYRKVHERSRWAASYMSTFGMHVHIGARDGEHAMALIHGAAPYLAHLLALSASSPFASGRDTGLASSRITVFESLPTTGTPPALASWAEFEQLVARMKACGAIEDFKDLLWDIRPSPNYGTVEVRICDGLADLPDTLALVCAIRGLLAWLDTRLRRGERFSPVANWRLRENKWRACRWGMDAMLVVSDQGEVAPARQEWEVLAANIQPFCEPRYFELLQSMLQRVPNYQWQRELFHESESLRTVVHELADRWRNGFQ